jgi:uncharacterized protein YceH (UPF0502 family)
MDNAAADQLQPSDAPKPATQPIAPAARWKPIAAIDRRVLGVLAEKAKTTPDAYPMSINGICTGANQKNNRFPIMQLETDDVQESLDRLRHLGAVTEVQGGGRVPRFRHLLYDWLGVDKIELAIMTELLLRGAQTEGELRGRAARMEPITDLGALRVLLNSLKAKKLIVPLTPEGRGHVLTHALYEPREFERLRAEQATMDHAAAVPSLAGSTGGPEPSAPHAASSLSPRAADREARSEAPSITVAQHEALQAEVATLRDEVAELRRALEDFKHTVLG